MEINLEDISDFNVANVTKKKVELVVGASDVNVEKPSR